MSFTVADIEDLIRLLEEQPESCARLRRLLLSGEPPDSQEDPAALRRDTDRRLDRFAAALERSGQEFDRRIAELTARMDGTDQRFAEMTARMDRYAEERAEADRRIDQQFAESTARMDRYAEERAEADRRIDQQFAESTARMDRYAEERAEADRRIDQQFAESTARMDRYTEERAEADRRIDQQFAESTARMDRYTEERAEADRRIDQQFAEIGKRVDELTVITRSHADDIGTLKGWNLEDHFRERPSAYLRSFFRRARAYTDGELVKLLDSGVERGIITEDDWEEVRLADVVVRGRRRDDGTEVFLVVEVSWGVGLYDLERAVRRAGILGRLVAPVLPVVAGRGVTADARSRCDADGVWLVLDGRVVPPNGTADSG
ncbi:MAG: hypothetical protein OXC12_15185 [Spirochaetaceae bacterium]|nr:hypothetical protein [Spirochaetaceae bacterium]